MLIDVWSTPINEIINILGNGYRDLSDIELKISLARYYNYRHKIGIESKIVSNPNFKNINSLSDLSEFTSAKSVCEKLCDDLIIDCDNPMLLNLKYNGEQLPREAYVSTPGNQYYDLNTGNFVTIGTASGSPDYIVWSLPLLSNTLPTKYNRVKEKRVQICSSGSLEDFIDFKNENKNIIIDNHLLKRIYFGYKIKGEYTMFMKNLQKEYYEPYEEEVTDEYLENWFNNAYKNFSRRGDTISATRQVNYWKNVGVI